MPSIAKITRNFPYLTSFLTALSWATTGIFIKEIGNINPFFLVWLRLLIAALIMLLIRQKDFSFYKDILVFDKNQLISLLCASMMTFYYVCTTWAFQLAPVSLVALFIALSPIITVIARFFAQEIIQKREVLGCCITILGIGIFLYYSNNNSTTSQENSHIWIGLFLSLLAATLKASYSFVLWKLREHNTIVIGNSFSLTLKTLIIGLIFLLPSAVTSGNTIPISFKTILLFMALGIISTALPTFLNSYASKLVNPTSHTVICLSTPIIASLLALFFLNEQIAGNAAIGIIVTSTGVLITLNPFIKK